MSRFFSERCLTWKKSGRRAKSVRSGALERARRKTLRVEGLEERRVFVGDITGTVFDDLNRNGTDDPGEPGLPGWTVFVDANGDGTLNAGEPATVTDTRGKYALTGLPAASTTVYEIPQVGYSPAPGFTDHQTIDVRDGREVRVKFPNVTTPVTDGSVIGTVFEDDNENGAKDSGEHGLSGWTMFLDVDGDGALTSGEPTATTDADGDYRFDGVPAGPTVVYEIPAAGYRPIVGGLFPLDGASDHRSVTVKAGASVRGDFGNLIPPVGTIQGAVWDDVNGDGIRGATENGLAGRTVFVDLNANGTLDASEPARTTDAAGAYAFTNIHVGAYRVVEVLPAGWSAAVGRSNVVPTTIGRGGVNTIDFFDLIPDAGSASGVAWNDANGDGVFGATESGLAGWQVYVDANGNGAPDAGERSTITEADGSYSIADVPYGAATLREVVPTNWLATNPTTGALSTVILNHENRAGLNFGAREKVGAIQGSVWNDANGDGLKGPTEGGLEGWTVFLDLNADGVQGAGEPATLTSASGGYSFTRLPTGDYRVVEVVQAGWRTTIGKAASATTTVTIGGVKVVDFYDLVPTVGSISGTLWSDLDSNGAPGAAEPVLAGWQVFLDVNGDGSLGADEPSTVTDAAGAYRLDGAAYGANVVQEIVQAGFTPTNHPGGRAAVSLLNGEQRGGVSFGNHELTEFTISGVAFHDGNGNGVRDAGERGLSGVPVYLDANDNGSLDPGERSTLASSDQFFTPAVDETGAYSFTHLTRGEYVVREVVPAEQSATPDAARRLVVSVGPTSASGANFANQFRASEIHGVVFDDTDADHVRDPGEYARPGVSVYIDVNRDDVYEEGEPVETTGADGSYAFLGLAPGAYVVREMPGVGPHTYPTTGGGILWPTGASHPAVGNISPSEITASLADGATLSQSVSITLPGTGGITNMVDVFLLFDDTGSFTGNSPIVRAAFPEIIASLQAALPGIDLGFGVGRFEEYGGFAGEFGTGRPFILNQPIVASSTAGFSPAIQAALDRMAPGYGGDAPETDIEALFQVVTGLGFDGNNNGTTSDSGAAGLAATQLTPGASGDVPSFASFQADPANNVLPASGTIGGAGFRSGALPIILTATDTGFAYQPKGETQIVGDAGLALPLDSLLNASRATTPFSSGAGIQETVTGLDALGALVIGLGTNPDAGFAPRSSLEALAKLTGAVNRSATTVANGTADPIAPGDPFYFQISSGFGATVADGVVNAIQNAVTNVALDIEVRASDPRVTIVNHTGVVSGVGAGQAASFDVQFTGDGRPHRFDLQFVRAGTNVVIGSIPVVLGTPVPGDGYAYEELEDGAIHQSSHFGNYVENVAPSFVAGPDLSIVEDAGPQSIAGWATSLDPGAPTEAGQRLNFVVSNDRPSLFAVQPTIAPDGTLAFTAAPNAFGTAIVTAVLHDDGGVGLSGADTSAPRTFLVTVAPVDDAPTATDDAYETPSSTPLSVPAAGVLTNDADVDGDALSATLVAPPAHGTLVLSADGSFVYSPNPGFAGSDSFTYVANDGTLDSNVATVAVTIVAQNHAPTASDAAYATDEDAALDAPAPGLLSGAADLDGDSLAVALVSGPAHGALTLNADGSFRYVPDANFHGVDSFAFRASDVSLDSNVATATLTVAPVNDAPTAVGGAFSSSEDVPLDVAAPGVLAGASDVDGDSLAATLVSGPAHGALNLNADGSFRYVPTANFNGLDTFTIRASDGAAESATVTVSLVVLAVNDPPTAVDHAYTTNEDATLSIAAPGVLAGGADVDGDALRAVRVTAPAHGTVALGVNGSFVYTPAANYFGTDVFTYKANDGSLDSNTATVTISIVAVNDAPVAANDAYSVARGGVLDVAARGVLANDSDVEGDALTAALVAGPAHGSLTLGADGALRYAPTAGYTGSDSFTYRASDGAATSNLATVSIVVAAPPPKFYVVDDGAKANFRYASDGAALANVSLNKSDSKPRGIASNATGSTQWVVDGSGTIFVYDEPGNLLGSWQPQNVGKPEGITVWGNDLWLVDPNQDRVFFFSGGALLRTGRANATSSFALNAANLSSTDLVTDGSHLWVLNDTVAADSVFRYSTSGTLQGSWTLVGGNPSPTGITLDPNDVNHLWIVDASTDRVYQYDGATSRLSGSLAASGSFALSTANGSAQGIADPRPANDLAAADATSATAAPVAAETSKSRGRRVDRESGATSARAAAFAQLSDATVVDDRTVTQVAADRRGAMGRTSRVDDVFHQLGLPDDSPKSRGPRRVGR